MLLPLSIRIYKFWKPRGALSTTEKVKYNIFSKYGKMNPILRNELIMRKCQPVGRLDKDSSGLLLLTSDESISNHLLGTFNVNNSDVHSNNIDGKLSHGSEEYGSKFGKEYRVTTIHRMSDEQINTLRNGITISTPARRKGGGKRVRKTLPIGLERGSGGRELLFTLREGRNRQIRRMVGALGHAVESLCRISFGGVDLGNLMGEGDLAQLTREELRLLQFDIQKSPLESTEN